MKVEFATFSEAGPAHENEDASYVSMNTVGLWAAIADGVGGHGDGLEASSAAIRVFDGWNKSHSSLQPVELFEAIQHELQQLVSLGRGNTRMATTFTALRLAADEVEFAHVGDTRLYHMRGSGFVTRTRDQSEVQELVDRGILTRRQADKYPRKNILTSVLGAARAYDLMVGSFKVEPGDTLVLCTDGLHGTLSKRDVQTLASESGSAETLASILAGAVKAAGPSDDFSATVIKILA